MRRMEKRREERKNKLLFYTALLSLLKVVAEIVLTIIKEID